MRVGGEELFSIEPDVVDAEGKVAASVPIDGHVDDVRAGPGAGHSEALLMESVERNLELAPLPGQFDVGVVVVEVVDRRRADLNDVGPRRASQRQGQPGEACDIAGAFFPGRIALGRVDGGGVRVRRVADEAGPAD